LLESKPLRLLLESKPLRLLLESKPLRLLLESKLLGLLEHPSHPHNGPQATPARKHSQYILMQRVLRQLQWIVDGRRLIAFLAILVSSVCCPTALLHPRHLHDSPQLSPPSKHTQYSFRQRFLRHAQNNCFFITPSVPEDDDGTEYGAETDGAETETLLCQGGDDV
jgi:hypothetical protein